MYDLITPLDIYRPTRQCEYTNVRKLAVGTMW